MTRIAGCAGRSCAARRCDTRANVHHATATCGDSVCCRAHVPQRHAPLPSSLSPSEQCGRGTHARRRSRAADASPLRCASVRLGALHVVALRRIRIGMRGIARRSAGSARRSGTRSDASCRQRVARAAPPMSRKRRGSREPLGPQREAHAARPSHPSGSLQPRRRDVVQERNRRSAVCGCVRSRMQTIRLP